MAAPEVQPALLRPGVLDGRTVAVTGARKGTVPFLARTCAELGARTPALEVDLLDEEAVAAAAGALGPVDTLVCDLAAPFVAAGGGLPGLSAALDGAWNAARAVANAAWIAADGTGAGGKLVLLAPAPGAGAHAGAVRAGAENLARTLSIEWARYAILPTAVLPGDGTSEAEIAQLVAFLASPGGDYYSGCAFTLGAV